SAISFQNQKFPLALDFTGDFDRLGDKVQHLLIDGAAVTGDKEEAERGAVGLANQEHGRDAAADAANGACAMRRERAGIHDAEVTFAVHDFADERLTAKANWSNWRPTHPVAPSQWRDTCPQGG